jgi:hypothetical protein
MGIIYDQPKGVALEGLAIGRGSNCLELDLVPEFLSPILL